MSDQTDRWIAFCCLVALLAFAAGAVSGFLMR